MLFGSGRPRARQAKLRLWCTNARPGPWRVMMSFSSTNRLGMIGNRDQKRLLVGRLFDKSGMYRYFAMLGRTLDARKNCPCQRL